MNSLYALSYVIFMTTIVIIIITLFFVEPAPKSYFRSIIKIKYYAAFIAVLEMINQTMVIISDEHLQLFKFYDYLITPLIYSVQLFFINKIILYLFYSNYKSLNLYFLYYTIGVLCVLSLSLMGIEIQIISKIEYLLLLAWISFSFYVLVKDKKRYFLLLENLYSEDNVRIGKCIAGIMHPVYIYFFIVLLDFIFYPTTNSPFLIVYSLIITLFVIKLLNTQNIYLNFEMIKVFNLKGDQLSEDYEFKDDMAVKENIHEVNADALKEIIVNWENREDKPFLKSGISLTDVAKQMDISPLKLSFYLNNLLKINFNNWINKLRIEEAKNIIRNNENISLSDISQMVGFSELGSFSKIFKKVEGTTPSNFKKMQSVNN